MRAGTGNYGIQIWENISKTNVLKSGALRTAQEEGGEPQGSVMTSHSLVSHLFLFLFFLSGYFKDYSLYLFHYNMSTLGLICVNPALCSEQTFNSITSVFLKSWKCSTFISQVLLLPYPPCLLTVFLIIISIMAILGVISSESSLEYTSPVEFTSITTYLIFMISSFFF